MGARKINRNVFFSMQVLEDDQESAFSSLWDTNSSAPSTDTLISPLVLLLLCLEIFWFSWILWSILKKTVSSERFGVLHHFFFLIWPPKTHSIHLPGVESSGIPQSKNFGCEHTGRDRNDLELCRELQSLILKLVSISTQAIFLSHQTWSNIPFPKWKICKLPQIAHLISPTARVEVKRGSGERTEAAQSWKGEKQELEITLGNILLLICMDRDFSTTNSSQRFQNKRKKSVILNPNFL